MPAVLLAWFAAATSSAVSTVSSDPILEWTKALAPIVAAAIAVIGVFITVWVTLKKSAIDARYGYAADVLKLRIRQVEQFYAPMRLLLEQSRAVYDKLLWSLEKLGEQNPAAKIDLNGFRLLDHAFTILTDKKYEQVTPLVKSILAIGDKLSDLLVKRGGLVEGGLTDTIVEYRAHLEMLKASAAQKPPVNVEEGWQQFGYYPRMLNREIAEGYKDAHRHIEAFLDAGDEIIGAVLGKMSKPRREALKMLLGNLAYYEQNVETYAERFDRFDLTTIRQRFLTALAESRLRPASPDSLSHILDAGCGTGRDTAAFIRAGYSVDALDISPAMLRLCRRRIRELKKDGDAKVRLCAETSTWQERSFDEIRARNEFDGVWAAASLLHVAKVDLKQAVSALVRAMKPGGVMFMSFRYGRGEAEIDSRHYSYFRHRELDSLLSGVPAIRSHEVWLSDKNGQAVGGFKSMLERTYVFWGGKVESWINVIAHKQS